VPADPAGIALGARSLREIIKRSHERGASRGGEHIMIFLLLDLLILAATGHMLLR